MCYCKWVTEHQFCTWIKGKYASNMKKYTSLWPGHTTTQNYLNEEFFRRNQIVWIWYLSIFISVSIITLSLYFKGLKHCNQEKVERSRDHSFCKRDFIKWQTSKRKFLRVSANRFLALFCRSLQAENIY